MLRKRSFLGLMAVFLVLMAQAAISTAKPPEIPTRRMRVHNQTPWPVEFYFSVYSNYDPLTGNSPCVRFEPGEANDNAAVYKCSDAGMSGLKFYLFGFGFPKHKYMVPGYHFSSSNTIVKVGTAHTISLIAPDEKKHNFTFHFLNGHYSIAITCD